MNEKKTPTENNENPQNPNNGNDNNNEQDKNPEAAELGKENKYLRGFVYGIIGASGASVLVIFWMVVLKSENLLSNLGNASYARGLITFVFALGTTAIAVILVIAVLLRRDEIIEKRFRQGREVLGILIGVLGTIVGFYFGATSDEVIEPPKIEAVRISEAENNFRTIGALIRGGESPYRYAVTFDSDKIEKIKDKTSEDGWILEQIELPKVAAELDVKFTVTVIDDKNQETEKSGEIRINKESEN